MKPTRSESPPVRVAVFASIAGGLRTPPSAVERAVRERRRLERARLRALPPTRPARGVS